MRFSFACVGLQGNSKQRVAADFLKRVFGEVPGATKPEEQLEPLIDGGGLRWPLRMALFAIIFTISQKL